MTLSDVLLALGMLLLLFEVIKGARPGAKYLTDHLLSLIVFGGAAAEFVMWPQFGTSTFFLLTLLAMVDFFGALRCATRRGLAPCSAGARRSTAVDARSLPNRRRTEPAPAPAPTAPPAAAGCRTAVAGAADEPANGRIRPSRRRRRRTVPAPELQPGADASRRPTRRSADLQIVCRVRCGSRASSDAR